MRHWQKRLPTRVANRLNANAGKAAVLTALFGAIPGSNIGALVLAAISGLYWWVSGDIVSELYDHPKRGVKLNVGTGWFHVGHE